jgi:hypothetical protein
VHNLEDTFDLSSSTTKEHFADSIKTTIALCKEYPSTVGRLSSIAKALNDDKVDPDPTSLPRMYIIETRFVKWPLGSHILDQLETCQAGHPNVEFVRNTKFLHEDKFWEQMTRCEAAFDLSKNGEIALTRLEAVPIRPRLCSAFTQN